LTHNGGGERAIFDCYDLTGTEAVERLSKFDVIVHLAALAHVDYSLIAPHTATMNNVGATASVLEAARRSGAKVVLASSVEVYSGDHGRPFCEDDMLAPRSPYGASKVLSETLAESYRRTFGIDVTVLRFTNLFGPWQAPDRVIPRVLRQRDLGIVSTATAGRVRDFLHVEDAARAVKSAVDGEFPSGTYNVCTGIGVPIDALVKALRDDDESAVRLVSTDKGRGFDLVAGSQRLRESSDWRPRHEVFAEVGQLQRWSEEHSSWLQQFDKMISAETGTEASLSDFHFPLVTDQPPYDKLGV